MGKAMAHRTPLYEAHLALGARMVDFAGWDMPVQYTSIAQEHQAVRSAAGIFDISHMGRFSFSGPGTIPLIQRIYTNNAATLKEGQVRYGLVCKETGGILDDVLVYGFAQAPGMVVNASNREKIFQWIVDHQGTLPVTVRDATFDTCMIAVQGPRALEIIRGLTPADAAGLPYYFATHTTYEGQPCLLSRTGYTGEDGVEFIVAKDQGPGLWTKLQSGGAIPCGLGARDTLRLEAAMPLYGHELTEEIDPLQAGLGWAVKLDKGDFIGREAMLKGKENSNRPLRVGLEIEGKRIAREQAAVLASGQKIGVVTSGTFAPTLEKVIAMAYVAPGFAAVGTVCEVDIRGKSSPAKVVRLPFYDRKRKS
jgi:aminomethyltransferase